MKRFWILILTAGIAIMAMSAYQYLTRPSQGDPAPAFALPAMDGSTFALGDFKGRPLLVHFWASWCGVCVQEFPAILRLANDMGSEGLAIVAIAEDGEQGDPAVRAFFRGETLPFPVLFDRDGATADAWQSFGVPESFLIGTDGLIAWRHAGPVDWDGHDVRARIRAAMHAGATP